MGVDIKDLCNYYLVPKCNVVQESQIWKLNLIKYSRTTSLDKQIAKIQVALSKKDNQLKDFIHGIMKKTQRYYADMKHAYQLRQYREKDKKNKDDAKKDATKKDAVKKDATK